VTEAPSFPSRGEGAIYGQRITIAWRAAKVRSHSRNSDKHFRQRVLHCCYSPLTNFWASSRSASARPNARGNPHSRSSALGTASGFRAPLL